MSQARALKRGGGSSLVYSRGVVEPAPPPLVLVPEPPAIENKDPEVAPPDDTTEITMNGGLVSVFYEDPSVRESTRPSPARMPRRGLPAIIWPDGWKPDRQISVTSNGSGFDAVCRNGGQKLELSIHLPLALDEYKTSRLWDLLMTWPDQLADRIRVVVLYRAAQKNLAELMVETLESCYRIQSLATTI